MDRVEAMRVFVKVVDFRSFTKAADSLHLAKGTVTRFVQVLEELANVRLLNRTTRNVSPTEEGFAYYDACVRVLEQIDSMDEEAANARRAPEGRIKVALSASLAKHILIPALPSFLAAYPKLDVELVVSDEDINLVQEAVDCTIRVGAIKETSVVAREVGKVTKIMCAAPSYLSQYGEPEGVADLRPHPILGVASNDASGIRTWSPSTVRDQAMMPVKNRVTVRDADSSVSCGILGLGIVSGYTFALRSYLECGTLREIMSGNRPNPEPVSIVYYPSRQMPNKLRVFVDWSREVLSQALRDSDGLFCAINYRSNSAFTYEPIASIT
jgi:LysR family transcriptional regulator for bpeEF and oprC